MLYVLDWTHVEEGIERNGCVVGCVWASQSGSKWILVDSCGSVKGIGHGSCRKKGVVVKSQPGQTRLG